MLSDATWAAIHRWVAAKLDIEPGRIASATLYLKSHGPTLADFHGVYVWQMGKAMFVSSPFDFPDAVVDTLAGQSSVGTIYAPDSRDPVDALIEPVFWHVALGERVERVVGPSYQGFVDAAAFQPADEQGARALTPDDQPALQRFVAACPPDDWRDSAIALDHEPIVGLERDGGLVALASAPLDGPSETMMRSVGVVTLPAWRGKGAGLAVVSALIERCLASGATLHYQTLRANLPSVAIARRLGFEDVATALAVRLR